jgi:hypothetical protein
VNVQDDHTLLVDAVNDMEESIDRTDVIINPIEDFFVAVNVKAYVVFVSPKF